MAMNPARLQMLRRLRPELGNLPDAQVAAMFGENEPSTTPIDMAQLIPQAQTVTPAAPAPMQPVQIQAPEPTQEQLAPPQVMPDENDPMAAVQAARAEQQARLAQNIQANQRMLQEAEAKAAVPEEIQQLLAQREARYTQEQENIDKDRKGAVWDAIAQAGFKMAQSQSPYFASALAEGMSAGLEGYDEAKAKAAEKKARLQDQKEQIALDRYDALTKARAAAREQLTAGYKLTADQMALANADDEAVLNAATMGAKISEAKSKAKVAEVGAEYAERDAQSQLALRQAQIYASQRSGGGGDSVNEKLFLRQYDAAQEAAKDFENALAEQDAAKFAAMADPENPELLGKMNAARIKAAAALRRAKSAGVPGLERYSLRGGPAGQAGAGGANYTYVPGKGLVPAR